MHWDIYCCTYQSVKYAQLFKATFTSNHGLMYIKNSYLPDFQDFFNRDHIQFIRKLYQNPIAKLAFVFVPSSCRAMKYVQV